MGKDLYIFFLVSKYLLYIGEQTRSFTDLTRLSEPVMPPTRMTRPRYDTAPASVSVKPLVSQRTKFHCKVFVPGCYNMYIPLLVKVYVCMCVSVFV